MSKVQFYKEENLKTVEADGFRLEIPEDWEVVRLESICKRIKAGGTPLTSKKEFWNGDIPFVKIEDITLAGKYLNNTKEKISKLGLENSSAWIVPENSLLLAMYGSLGEVTINKIQAATNQAILGIIPDNYNVEFLYYWFLYFKPNWKRYAKPTTQANLTAEIVKNSKIPLPPLQEQQKIAHVLMNIDKAIETIDEAIKQAERIKKGLMQELLTKGIGHKEFKDTEIGRIPKEWGVVRLGDSKEIKLIMGQSPPGKTYNKEGKGIPFIQGKAEFGEIYPNPILWTTQPTKIAKKGDILISVRAPVGDVNLCPFELCIGRGLAAIRIKEESNLFYFYWFQKAKKLIENIGKGSTFKAITKKELENVWIPLPPLQEQQKIAEILSKWDEVIELKKAKKERLERMKKKFMDLLLTGKVRVKMEEDQNAPTT